MLTRIPTTTTTIPTILTTIPIPIPIPTTIRPNDRIAAGAAGAAGVVEAGASRTATARTQRTHSPTVRPTTPQMTPTRMAVTTNPAEAMRATDVDVAVAVASP